MDYLSVVYSESFRTYSAWVVVFLILTPLEMLIAHERQTFGCRLRGLSYWAIFTVIAATVAVLLSAIWRAMGIHPLINISVIGALGWAGPLAAVGAALAGAFAGDFIGYWFHRAQHAWFWRWHAVHHSIRNLNAVNSYHHVSDTVISSVVVTIPTTLIFFDYGTTIPLLVFVMWVQAAFLHSPTKVHFGAFRRVFADNRFHRIHHSVQVEHFDKNFGVMSTLWDQMFGTAHFPTHDEWPDVGLHSIDEPAGIREWLDLPIRYDADVEAAHLMLSARATAVSL